MTRTAVIFGATSGLGWKLGNVLLLKGWNIVMFGRRLERLLGFKAGICGNEYTRCLTCVGDITNPKNVRETLAKAIERFGSIECVRVLIR